MLCMKIRKEETGRRGKFLRKLERKFQRLSLKKRLHSENMEGKIEGEDPEMRNSEPFSKEGIGEGATLELSDQMTSYGDKLAEAERKLSEQIIAKKKKKTHYKTIIEENENHLKALSKQMKDTEDTIKKKEDKIVDMRIERNDLPLLKRFGTQLHIAKSTLRKERLQDDLSVMKSQSASRRRKIQKYKTKIRYDLQILHDPFMSKPKVKQATRPIPDCFYGLSASTSTCKDDKEQLVTSTINNEKDSTPTTPSSDRKEHVVMVKEKLSSIWSLSSIDDDEMLLVQQTPGGPSGLSGCRNSPPTSQNEAVAEKGCSLANCEAGSSGSVGLYDLEREKYECVTVGKDCNAPEITDRLRTVK